MSITFSTCFYIIQSKFPKETYIDWLNNFISIVNEFYLVIYTDANTLPYIKTNNPKIKIVIKPLEEFYNYKYKEDWIRNHSLNTMLNAKSSWELNMLWSEKIRFVKESSDKNYFNTDMHGWCDAGYFRNRNCDLHTHRLQKWPDKEKIQLLDKNQIYYAFVNGSNFMDYLKSVVNKKNENGLPIVPIAPNQVSVAGGFFIIHKNKIDWWATTFDAKLQLYFKHHYLVKDDQLILADCIFSVENQNHFFLCIEQSEFDNWFMFQRAFM